MCDHRSRPYHRAFSDRNPRKHHRSAADRRTLFHPGWDHLPVSLGLQPSVLGCPGIQVVGKHHAVANENVILDSNSLADKAVRGYFAAAANRRILLDFHKRADLGLISDGASVKIDQLGLKYLDALTEDHIRGNWHETVLAGSAFNGSRMRALTSRSCWKKAGKRHDTTESTTLQLLQSAREWATSVRSRCSGWAIV